MKFARFARVAWLCGRVWDVSIQRTAVEIWSEMQAPLEISA